MQDTYFKVIIVGKQGVGLSTLLRNYTGIVHSNDLYLTLGVDFYVKDYCCDESPYKMQLWGFSEFFTDFNRSEQYFRGAKGLILLYDLTDLKSLQIVPVWVKFVVANELNIPSLLLGNKVDLSDSRQVFSDDITYFKDKYNISLVHEISAEKGTNVDNAFNQFLKRMVNDDSIECHPVKSFEEVELKDDQLPNKESSEIIPFGGSFKVIVFGKPNQNRTLLIQRFLGNLFVSDSKQTVRVDFGIRSLIVDDKRVKLQIWDFLGEERSKFLLPTYVRGARGGIFIFDVDDYSSLSCIEEWLSLIKKELNEDNYFPIIAAGLITDTGEDRQVSSEEAIKISKASRVDGYIECNLKTGENVEKMFEALVGLMIENEKV